MSQNLLFKNKDKVVDLYKKGNSMMDISKNFNISLDSVVYFFRRNKINRRSTKEASIVWYNKQKPSFVKRNINTIKMKELSLIIAMLYWGEGYKGTKRVPANTVDFANSDSKMILIFINALRKVFSLDETKFRVYLYCYSDQNISKIISFWSNLTKIPKNQFTKPYIRNDFNPKSNKMINGLIHIRYNDKKLLLEIKSMIDYYVSKYASIV